MRYQVAIAAKTFLPLILMVACYNYGKTGQEDRTTRTGGLHGMVHYSRSTICCCYSLNPRPEEEEEEKGTGFNQLLARSFLLFLFRPENKAMLPSGLVSRFLHPAQILRMCMNKSVSVASYPGQVGRRKVARVRLVLEVVRV